MSILPVLSLQLHFTIRVYGISFIPESLQNLMHI